MMRVLILGKLKGEIITAGKLAIERGAKVAHVASEEEALHALRSGQGADLVMVEIGFDLAALITGLKNERIHVPVVACGIGSDTDAAVAAIRAGAKEYIPLPPDAEMIAAVLSSVAEDNHTLICQSLPMRELLDLAKRIAPSEASVLITGESGTGKEIVARFVHRESRRSKKAFISVNCAAIPENLLESELFGHEKGAFTGALARRIGKFEEAHHGTLLLDEISEMDPRLQAKLLRALQEREIDRLGGTTPVKVDIRLIATSNRDLEQAVQEGHFREDLYFRLNVVHLALPPLRERIRDIVPLAEYFVHKYAQANQLPTYSLTASARAKLEAYHWRGNVRELENTLHRAVLLACGAGIDEDTILLPNRQPTSSSENERMSLVGRTVAEVERDLIIDTLGHCLGNRTHAATILGISIRTLRNKLRQYHDEGFAAPESSETEKSLA